MPKSQQKIFDLLKSDMENLSCDGFNEFTLHALESKSLSYFKSFLDADLVDKQKIQKWAETYFYTLPYYQGNEHFGNAFGKDLRRMLIEHGICVDNWTKKLLSSLIYGKYQKDDQIDVNINQCLLLLDIQNGGDVTGYEDDIVSLGNLEILRAMQKHGYTNFSIYACKDLPTLIFIEEEAGGIECQIHHGSREWMKLLARDVEMTRYLVHSGIDLKLDSTNAEALNCVFVFLNHSLSEPQAIELITQLVEGGADINIQDDDGKTVLHRAFFSDYREFTLESLKAFIALNADPAIANHKGESVLLRLVKNKDDFAALLNSGFMLTKELSNTIIEKTMDQSVIVLESKNTNWIDPCSLNLSENIPLPAHIIQHIFSYMLLTGSRGFILYNDKAKVRLSAQRLLAEYFFSSMKEADAKRHLDYFIHQYKEISDKIFRVQIAFLFHRAAKQQMYKTYLEAQGIDLSEVNILLSLYFQQNLFSIKKRYTVYIVPQYDLDTFYIEELTSETFDAYAAKYPYSPFYEETQDGFFLTEGIAGLGYANHFVFLKESTIRLRQERSIVLYSSPTKSNRYPIEVYEEKIRGAYYEGVTVYCGDGYDWNMFNKPNVERHYTVLCKYPETFKVINAHDTMDRAEYYAAKDVSHRRAVDIDGVTQAQNNYEQAIANYKADRDL
ncbi:MAG: hypothetical protein Q7T77_03835 [Sulfuricurvum sp.]|nr:hypothetical protein [Sulfuricurvum sp.]